MTDLYDEISEELRAEKARQFFQNNYKFLLALVVVALAAAAGFSAWQNQDLKKQSVATSALLQAADSGKNTDLEKIAGTAPVNQAVLADMILAGQYHDQNKPDQSMEIYKKVSTSVAPQFWRDLAQYNLAVLQSDKDQTDDALKSLTPLLVKNKVLYPMALELKAATEAKQGNAKKAFDDYAELSALHDADESQRARATQFMRYYQS